MRQFGQLRVKYSISLLTFLLAPIEYDGIFNNDDVSLKYFNNQKTVTMRSLIDFTILFTLSPHILFSFIRSPSS